MASLYETHLHTREGSGCGVSSGREYVQRYLDLGYTGIIITDHFYRGNCAVSRMLSWEKWVHKFCRGYEIAREEGARRGLDVFFGWEESFQGDDYLVYGLDKEWLLEHPEAIHWTRKQQFDEVRRYGGCVVQAHPFRQQSHIRRIRLSTGCVDAVEAANAGNGDASCDALAYAYAQKLRLPVTSGSDVHSAYEVRDRVVMGVLLEKKMESITDYVSAIRGGTIAGLRVSPKHFTLRGNEYVYLPVEIRDANDKVTGKTLDEFFED